MDGIRATPYINPLLGSANDIIGGLLGYMRDPRRTQQLQGLAGLLESTGIPKTVERLAYGEPLTNIQRANVPLLRPETAEALLTVAPVPPVAGRAAMAAGRAGERMAERMVPQIMERGGMPAGLLEGMSSRTVSPLTVYHGSPAKFERFDPTKIGSGEGAQAYGYGHYVAQNPAVAKEYRTALSEPELFVKGRQIKTAAGSNMDTAKAWLQDSFEMGAKNPYADAIEKVSNAPLKDKQGVIDALRKLENRGVQMQKGGFEYEIDLPDEQIARMLDWDKPLSQQPEILKALTPEAMGLKLREPVDGGFMAYVDSSGKPIGFQMKNTTPEKFRESWIKRLQEYGDAEGGAGRAIGFLGGTSSIEQSAISEALRKAGIPGIRYLDQGSRGTGEGTSNFVVFPGGEDLLTILRRNGGLLGP